MNTAILQKQATVLFQGCKSTKKLQINEFSIEKMVRHLLSDMILTKIATTATHVMLVSGLRPK